MYEAMAPYGNVTYTEYDSTSHFCWNYAWSKTLDDDGNGVSNLEDAIDWMFNQSRKGTLDHTVDKAPLKRLMKKAEAASAADYDPKTLEKIARLAQEGETLLANVAATQEETARLCKKLPNGFPANRPVSVLNKGSILPKRGGIPMPGLRWTEIHRRSGTATPIP